MSYPSTQDQFQHRGRSGRTPGPAPRFMFAPALAIFAALCVTASAFWVGSSANAAPPRFTQAQVRPTDKAKVRPSDKATDRAGDKKTDRRGTGNGAPTRFNKYRLSPEEVKTVVELVEKSDPALANKLRRIMVALARRQAGTDRPTAIDNRKPPQQLTDEQIAAAIEIFRDRDVELAARIEKGLKENPDRVRRMIAGQWGRLERMIALKKQDPSLYRAQTKEIQSSYKMYRIAAEIRHAKPGADTTKLRQTLRSYVTAHVEARRNVRKLELKRLEDRVKKLRKQIEDNEAKLEKSVDVKMKDLLKPRTAPKKTKSIKSDSN